MKVSLNEVEAALRRAAMGAGWAFGIGEELGRATAWLEAHGIAAVANALQAVTSQPQPAVAERSGNGWNFPDAKAVVAGPSACDLLATAGTGTAVEFANPDHPLLLIGFAGVAAQARGGGYRLENDGRIIAEISGHGAGLTDMPLSPSARLRLIRRETGPASGTGKIASGIEIDDGLWSRALAMAAKSYVPASDASRLRGAGAGLTDND